MEPFAIVTINNKNVALPPSQTNSFMVGALTVFLLPHPLQAGRNVCHCHSPCPWLFDLIVAQLVVLPRNNVLVASPIFCPCSDQVFHTSQREGPLSNLFLGVLGGNLEPWNLHNVPQKDAFTHGIRPVCWAGASGQGGCITPAALGIPTASERGAKSEVAHLWARWLHNPCRLGDPHRLRAGGQNQKWPTSGQGSYITLAFL